MRLLKILSIHFFSASLAFYNNSAVVKVKITKVASAPLSARNYMVPTAETTESMLQ